MNGAGATTAPAAGAAKLIAAILPDDGGDRRLLAWLRDHAGVTRANSVYCRGHAVLQETAARQGHLPEPTLVRLVNIVVEAEQADALFAQIHAQAGIGRPGGGALMMLPLTAASALLLPEDVPNEAGELSE
ncbi:MULTISPECIES: hypothetical protein [Thiorhodovibrio]|uniref:hypothetical protein n=1 Tax=Thiorhodovibrio TaxID=61593 RepID=UPI001911FA9F|nr:MULTISPECIES: hypothetical protein [Thiorhodovibrio]MBK5967215.1 hypothetical protein [Thiorhodovibrio winogradskyi]WPL14894.1 hypothetical protein Thiosp_04750 [Thiorhodovibrio litoralis]